MDQHALRRVLQAGFIDFTVEPSFQVLGNMIERIVTPKSPTSDEKEGEAKRFERPPEKRDTPVVSRRWMACFKENKEAWTALAPDAKPKT
ncbi:unnamed protein product [Calicophoron daubneyi]|uniref:Uncharacterized protein n=1 Tax=Calicophoron daubneyi TaxID=300641 RepID=A0AAV2TD83_CALDB